MNRQGKLYWRRLGRGEVNQRLDLSLQCGLRPRLGLTVLELMVSTMLVAILIGLLLPAVMSVRESSRQMECSNHLRQIGLAVHNYHNQAKRLPASWSAPSRQDRFVEAWSAHILAQLEQTACADRLRTHEPEAFYRSPTQLVDLQLPIFLCPSDIAEPFFALTYRDDLPEAADLTSTDHSFARDHLLVPGLTVNNEQTYLPSANYVGVYGTVEADDFHLAVIEPGRTYGDGAIIDDTRVRLDDLRHGTSQTFIVGERTMAKIPSTWWGVDLDGDDAGCRVAGSAITHPNCEVCDECEFSSRHRGGSMFLWGDGHVSLLNDSIDTEIYRGAAKRGY